jgi:hypothetical protein
MRKRTLFRILAQVCPRKTADGFSNKMQDTFGFNAIEMILCIELFVGCVTWQASQWRV